MVNIMHDDVNGVRPKRILVTIVKNLFKMAERFFPKLENRCQV